MARIPALLAVLGTAAADVYGHMPRCSNNRLNEKSANRNNADRLFDSQNNNRGGYNVGDATTEPFADSNNAAQAAPHNLFDTNNQGQYAEIWYEGSELQMEWTAQHGCGGHEETDPHKLHCNMVIQYTCNTNNIADTIESIIMQNGQNTQTPDKANSYADAQTKISQNRNNGRGRHESEYWYWACENRPRNKGLFTADQKLKGDAAKYTRQNPNGNRRGLECPEERDYYPYWHPTPWIDVAVLTSNIEDCTDGFNYVANSGNVKDYPRCGFDGATNPNNPEEILNAPDTATCVQKGGTWMSSTNHGVKAPECMEAQWSRVNHLGNSDQGQTPSYTWTLPSLSGTAGTNRVSKFTEVKSDTAICATRLRYNISTMDYDIHSTNASHNEDINNGVVSPVEQNPTINVDTYAMHGLRLAINTAQFGRTFQDRSHTFYLKAKPTLNQGNCGKIKNLQVRGKRGNIVQTFPSVEYDFTPNEMEASGSDCIHVQWTGSNTHNNGNPAGDGQAGDAGEGKGGTDRHNMAELACPSTQYPKPFEQSNGNGISQRLKSLDGECATDRTLWDCFDCYIPDIMRNEGTGEIASSYESQQEMKYTKESAQNCAIYMISGSYYKGPPEDGDEQQTIELLNEVTPSLIGGVMLKPKAGQCRGKKYWYMNTRNNNFSNRGQKGALKISN